MSDNVLVNAERSAVVDEADPGKKYQMPRKEAIRLGLLPDADAKPQARRNGPEDSEQKLNAPREDTARTFSTTRSPATSKPRRSVKK